MNGVDRIDEVHAWIVRDVDGTEGVPLVQVRGIGAVPLVTTAATPSGAVVGHFHEMAKQAAEQLEPGQTMTHVVFRERFDLEQL